MAVISLAMVFFGFKMWKNGSLENKKNPLVLPEKISVYFRTPFGMLASGLVIGLLTGIFGAGGGLSIFIILYSFLDFPLKTAVGTSSFIMCLTAFSGVMGYAEHGNLDLYLGIVLGVSAAVGGVLSSLFVNKINDRILARIIGGVFIFFAIVMLVLKVILPLLKIDI